MRCLIYTTIVTDGFFSSSQRTHSTALDRPTCARYPAGVVGSNSSGGGGEEGFTGRAAIRYDHGYDAEVFYLGLALDERYVEGWVEGCLKRIREGDPDEERLFRDLWEDEGQREVVIETTCPSRSDTSPAAGGPSNTGRRQRP